MKSLFINTKDFFYGKAPWAAKRSKDWPKLRNKLIKKYAQCQCCGSTRQLEVHHVIPFYLRPDLELDESNCIVLCQNGKYGINCHLLVGHLGNYRRFNPDVFYDAMTWFRKLVLSK